MSLLKKNKTSDSGFDGSPNSDPEIQFGRYTDRHKTPEQISSWDKSIAFHKDKNYLDAYHEFMIYLKDENIENVRIIKENDKVKFEIIQGSKVVTGYADDKKIVAEAEVASFENKAHVAVMRKLLAVNYDLYFSKFAIKDNVFTLKFSAPVQDAPPPALYASLKEVANQSDKYDDVLTEEFSFLKPVNVGHIQELPDAEKEVKFEYLKESISSTINKINEFAEHEFAGARSFLLLQLTFKLHYLLAPEGVLLDDLRYIQGIYFRRDNSSTAERNHLMVQEYNKIINKPKEEILKSFYKSKATFAVVKPTAFESIANLIHDELEKINLSNDNKYYDIQQAICDYIVAYAEFFYGMDAPIYDLFEIYWRTTNDKYYNNLGFYVDYFNADSQTLKQSEIENDILKIISNYKKKYPFIDFKTHNLKYGNLAEFSTSFLYEVKQMNLNLK